MNGLLVVGAAILSLGAWALSLYSGTFLAGPSRTVAAALAEHHQAAVAAVLAAPTLSGPVTPTLPAWKPAGRFASCADGAGVVGPGRTQDASSRQRPDAASCAPADRGRPSWNFFAGMGGWVPGIYKLPDVSSAT